MFIETDFEDEIELVQGNKVVTVGVFIKGEIDDGDQEVNNITIKSVYSLLTEKKVKLKNITHNEMKRLTEKAKEKLLITYQENCNDMVSSGYDDGLYYDNVHDDEQEEVRKYSNEQ